MIGFLDKMSGQFKHFRVWLLLLAIVVVGGGLYFFAVTPASVKGWIRHDIAKEVFGSEENLKIFATSEILVARRLTPLEHGGTLLGSYEMGSEILVPQANMDLIRNLVQQESSYDWNVVSMCLPEYGVLLTARDEKDKEVHLAICFKCQQLSIFEGYEIVGTVSFGKMQRRLANLIKPLFPNDPAIQALH